MRQQAHHYPQRKERANVINHLLEPPDVLGVRGGEANGHLLPDLRLQNLREGMPLAASGQIRAQRLDLRYAIAAFVGEERRDDVAVQAMLECLREVASQS